ncbi:MAG TPA: MFS transporter, partial [Actinomycetota bacterium]|nr:MFS transporter [Actinomycetota bacterium]
QWVALIVAFGLIGVLSGMLDSLGARFLAVSGSVSRAGLAAGSYGVGATVGPVIIAVTDSVVAGFLSGAVVALVAAVAVRAPALTWPAALRLVRAAPGDAEGGSAEVIPLARLLTAPAVLVSLGLFAAFVSIEVTTGGWLATVLEDARGVDDRLAGLSVGAFWSGITIGRLLLGRFDLPDRALLFGVGVLVVSFTGLAVVPAPFVLPLALVAGVALAPQFPTLLAHTGDRVGEEAAGRVSGWQLIAANVAATSLAALTGVIVAATGPAAPLAVLVAVSAAGGVLLVLAPRVRATITSGT